MTPLAISTKTFATGTDNKIIKGIVKVTLLWYFFDTAMFFLVGLSEANLQTFFGGVFLVFWYLATDLFYNYSKKERRITKNFTKLYLPIVLVLSVLEETLVFLNGGGLGGKAESLTQDLLLAVPIFLGIAIGILLLNHWMSLTNGEIFVLAAIQGFIIEILFSGNLLIAWFLGGPALGIYGMMMAAVGKEYAETSGERSTKNTLILLLLGTVLCFVCVIFGAIVGDTIYNAII